MQTDLYKKVEQWVVDSFTKAGRVRGVEHFKRTVYWLLQLKLDADVAFQIAAIAHDMERSTPNPTGERVKKSERGYLDPDLKKEHQDKGAEMVAEFLNKQGADEQLIDRVKMLI